MNKYYTPELEEFHVGFRYETMWGLENINEEWLKDVWKKSACIDYLDGINTRVKFLDRDDIEELGWEYVNDNVFRLTSKSGSSSRFGSTPYLEIMENGTILITRGFSSYMGTPQGIVFKGDLKNYNELKFIMERIGING